MTNFAKNMSKATGSSVLQEVASSSPWAYIDETGAYVSTYCVLVKLPKPPRAPGYGHTSVTSFANGVVPAESAVKMLSGSDTGNRPRRGIVVYDDDLPHDVSNTMSATAVFMAEAFGRIKEGCECYCIPKMQYLMNKEDIDLGRLHVVADLCDEPVLGGKAPITREDFTIDFSCGPDDPDVEYVGELPPVIMDLLGVGDVQDAIISAYYGVTAASERFDLPDAFDILEAMSFGHSALDPRFYHWGQRGSKAMRSYRPLVSDFVIADSYVEQDGYKPYAALCKEIGALQRIWQTLQERSCLGVRVGLKEKRDRDPSAADIKAAMKIVSDMLGISSTVDAYYRGIPVDDLLA